MAIGFIGTETGARYDPSELPWKGAGGELLDVAPFPVRFPMDRVRTRPPTLWRYLEALPFAWESTAWTRVTMGEGFTPLVPLDPDAADDGPRILAKVEYQMPTLSFKDRGAAVLIAKALELGVTHVVQDSSGNAGASIAAYAARARMRCEVYVPTGTSAAKTRAIAGHGATVTVVPGTREDCAAAAAKAANAPGVFYASHVHNPFFHEGTKTYAYEIWEQLGEVPDTLVLPVGNGTLVLGAVRGFTDLRDAGLSDRLPRVVAVQAAACAPLARAFVAGRDAAEPVVNAGTAAEGIAIAAPARHRQILAAVRATGGAIVSVSEGAIATARSRLATRGWHVEPTTAVNLAVLAEYPDLFVRGECVVVPLCGAGAKAA